MKFKDMADYTLEAYTKTFKYSSIRTTTHMHMHSLELLYQLQLGKQPGFNEHHIDTYKFTKCILEFCASMDDEKDDKLFLAFFKSFQINMNNFEYFLDGYYDYVLNRMESEKSIKVNKNG